MGLDLSPKSASEETDLSKATFSSVAGGAFRLLFKDPGCDGGQCPTVYEAPNGDVVVQGYELDAAEKERLAIPVREGVVRLPRAFFDALLKAQRS